MWELFDRCLPLDIAARVRVLNEEAGGKQWLRTEVESLLAQSDQLARLGPSLRDRLLGSKSSLTESAPTEQETPWVPQRTGKYLLFHRLGLGGMAEVFLGKPVHAAGFDRPVAVKRIHQAALGDATLRKYFAAEARLAGVLTHPNIVHVYDCEEYDGNFLLVMELIQGVNLQTVVKRLEETQTTLPPDLAVAIVREIAGGLSYAHRRRDDATGMPLGIVHRDISPKNIMLDYEGGVKIIDFGIAKASHRAKFTQTGMVIGTLGYLAPELPSGKTVDGRCDVYAACLVLFELLSAKRFYDNDDPLVTMGQLRDAEFTASRLRELPDSDGLRQLIERGLAQDAELRPTSTELGEALEAHLTVRHPPGASKRLGEFLQGLFAKEKSELKDLLEKMHELRSDTGARKKRGFRPWYVASSAAAFGILLVILYLGRSMAPSTGRAPANVRVGGCETEAATFCPDRSWKSGLGVCLMRLEDKLSPACRKTLDSMPCVQDVMRLCSSEPPLGVRDCLRRRHGELSLECQREQERR